MEEKFNTETKSWQDWVKHPKILIVDYHDGKDHGMPYWEHLVSFHNRTIEALKKAQAEGMEYVLCTHGSSTSRRGNPTARSEVRKIMRGSEGTPYIIRKKCIDYGSAFLAAICPPK